MSADKSSASMSLSLSGPGDDQEVGDVNDVKETVAATFKEAMEKMDARLVPLCARVFYKCGHSVARQISRGLQESFHSALPDCTPSLSLVPVLDLPDSQILHLSCWLSS